MINRRLMRLALVVLSLLCTLALGAGCTGLLCAMAGILW